MVGRKRPLETNSNRISNSNSNNNSVEKTNDLAIHPSKKQKTMNNFYDNDNNNNRNVNNNNNNNNAQIFDYATVNARPARRIPTNSVRNTNSNLRTNAINAIANANANVTGNINSNNNNNNNNSNNNNINNNTSVLIRENSQGGIQMSSVPQTHVVFAGGRRGTGHKNPQLQLMKQTLKQHKLQNKILHNQTAQNVPKKTSFVILIFVFFWFFCFFLFFLAFYFAI